jgi:hypothetical protein
MRNLPPSLELIRDSRTRKTAIGRGPQEKMEVKSNQPIDRTTITPSVVESAIGHDVAEFK